MLNRYLGNKTVLLEEILDAVGTFAQPGAWVCDIFSGSLAVSLALKRTGYRVAANDINLLSAVAGHAYLLNNEVPGVDLVELVGSASRAARFAKGGAALVREHAARDGFDYLTADAHSERAHEFAALVAYLQDKSTSRGLPREFARTDFFDHYCEAGSKSAFVSSRGRAGRRRFFSSENATHIDAVVNHLRYWRHNNVTDDDLEALLLSVLGNAVERVSNTQGTYHDFPRDSYDPRALNPMLLRLPALDGLIGDQRQHLVGHEEDSLNFIRRVPKHDVLYIDPPYNFRQYTAYYFLPNVLCRYPTLSDPGEYFDHVRYVRGQNPADDFVSSFCKAKQFIPSLRELIDRAKTRTVVLSYFDGRNHWNAFKEECNGEGYRRLTEFFGEDLFEPGSLEVRPVNRLNYQSYGGYKARTVAEYLFVAQKRE
jgi:adenine-specific DNA-methyltransferase